MSETLMRFTTILVLISLIGLIILLGNHAVFVITVYLICSYAFYEWLTFTSKSKVYLPIFLSLIFLLHYLPVIFIKYLSLAAIIFWSIVIVLMFFSTNRLKSIIKKYSNIFGLFILSVFFLHLVNFYPQTSGYNDDINLEDGKYYLIFFIMLLSSIDIFSYLSGKIFGTLRVVPNISPNKTVQGYLGGYIFTIIMFSLFSNVFEVFLVNFDLLYLSFLILLAFSGDLFMSLVKRTYHIKDTGSLLPGHGGLLDRLDSYLPSVPLFYLWVII